MENLNETLKSVAQILLDPQDNYGEIKNAVDRLYELLTKVADLDENSRESHDDIFLPSGKAIGPLWAAMCLKEFMRTRRFVQGLNEAIKQAKKTFPGKTIHILYAGTGPFATLILPLTTVYTSNDIKCTLLEINLESIKSLNKIINAFGIESYIYEIVQCDAAAYKAQRPIHIAVAEVMQNALKKEPQVAVTINLAPQLEKGGIFIPEEVNVNAALLKSTAAIEEKSMLPIGEIFNLNRDTTRERAETKILLDIPQGAALDHKWVYLLTEIKVFDRYYLGYNQCSLTLPYKLCSLDKLDISPKNVCLQYIMDDKPRFSYEFG
jgi:hypothetical protein